MLGVMALSFLYRVVGLFGLLRAPIWTSGYWLVASNGQVRGYDAKGPMAPAGTSLRSRVVAIAADPFGTGYWLVSNNGAVHAHGSAALFRGY
jgi:hypothetical protein